VTDDETGAVTVFAVNGDQLLLDRDIVAFDALP
jgi:hypothetical protein